MADTEPEIDIARRIEMIVPWIAPHIRGDQFVRVLAKELRVPERVCHILLKKHFVGLPPDPDSPPPARVALKPDEPPPVDLIETEVVFDESRLMAKPFGSIMQIKRAVARHYGVTVADLEGRDCSRRISGPRQIAMALCYRRLYRRGMSLPMIARHFGQRHHTTVLFALKKLSKRGAIASLHLDRKLINGARPTTWRVVMQNPTPYSEGVAA